MSEFGRMLDEAQERIAVLERANAELNDELERHATQRAHVQKLVEAARRVGREHGAWADLQEALKPLTAPQEHVKQAEDSRNAR